MHKIKHFALVILPVTLLAVAVGFYLIKRFAPDNVKQFFTVA